MQETVVKNHKRLFLTILAALTLYGIAVAETREYSVESAGKTPEREYVFAVLGDLHFDRLHHHDMNWVRATHPGDVKQIEDYSHITNQNTRPLLESVLQSLKIANCPTFAILQSGDFVEGLCGSYELQSVQFNEAVAFVGPLIAPIPLLITKGNHDITGPGADKAYSDIIMRWIEKQLQTTISGTSYYVSHKSDLFIFFDCYKPDLDWLAEVLHQNPARHVFFVIHKPVVPYNERASWHIFSSPEEQHQRQTLLSLLGKYRAVVLSGHLHYYSALVRKTDGGCFVQLGLNSVIDMEQGKVELLEGIDKYGPDLVNREANLDPQTEQTRSEILTQEKPFIDYFELAKTSCYSVIGVSDNGIDVDMHLRSNPDTWRRLRIALSNPDAIHIGLCSTTPQNSN